MVHNCLVATLVCTGIPFVFGIVFYDTTIDMIKLNKAIESPLSVTSMYPCSLIYYRILLGVMIRNYIANPLFVILMEYTSAFFIHLVFNGIRIQSILNAVNVTHKFDLKIQVQYE